MAYGSVLTDVVQSSTSGTPPQFNDGNGTQVGTLCRAWVNFNGNNGSVAARASYNVSSITRNSAGNYTITMTNALSDANYSVVCSVSGNGTNGLIVSTPFTNGAASSAPSTSAFYITAGNPTVGYADVPYVNVSVFR